MTVIHTSPAIHLQGVLPGGLGALPGVIGEIIVPFEVGQELAVGHAKDSAWREIQRLPGIHHRTEAVAIHPLISAQIDLGEAAVIQTALDESLTVVVLDDLKARRVALTLGLQVTGTVGILLFAKQVGMLPSVGAAIRLLETRGMWIAPSLAARAIRLAGE
jgi:predicted nucleic acid-binding protein